MCCTTRGALSAYVTVNRPTVLMPWNTPTWADLRMHSITREMKDGSAWRHPTGAGDRGIYSGRRHQPARSGHGARAEGRPVVSDKSPYDP